MDFKDHDSSVLVDLWICDESASARSQVIPMHNNTLNFEEHSALAALFALAIRARSQRRDAHRFQRGLNRYTTSLL